jgi:hypothetical protein
VKSEGMMRSGSFKPQAKKDYGPFSILVNTFSAVISLKLLFKGRGRAPLRPFPP